MPDSLGRYFLSEMQNRIYRLLNLLALVIDPATGNETSSVIQTQGISNTDLTQQINTSLMGLYTEVALQRPDQYSQTFYVTVGANNIGPYSFPPGMLQLRYMDWKDPGITVALNLIRPEQWHPMVPLGDPADRDMTNTFRGPTWEWDNSGTGFVLNNLPRQNNSNGVRIRAVVLPPALALAGDVIQARFARVMQEAVIYDAAYALGWSKRKQVSDEVSKGKDEWHTRLLATAENAFHPDSVVSITNRLVGTGYNRRVRGWRRGGGW